MDEEKDSTMQGELFQEIRFENDVDGEHDKKKALEKKKKFVLNFDKFLILLLVLIIIFVIAFAFGVERGKLSTETIEGIKNTTKGIKIVELPNKQLEKPVVAVPPSGTKKPEEIIEKPETLSIMDGALDKKWTIQVVTYKSETMAQNEVKRLRKDGLNPFIIPSGDFFQVCVNTFESSQEAKKVLPLFAKEKGYYDAFVRKVKR